ncbi:MAG TPA: Coenzyme F420 hydrogenase/dehydrogenase, beta subunit C-terminal domain [Methanobacterium sp.]|jgi:coenzyme F420 hydrogenase subunit beta|nr:MAG: 4Fe-4S dicluster domain-containing protein [Methanobacterium sp.]HOI39826.1 Coenzyme F420 hydrogenase/dehydrogenase, beta subunit C-terminal domain [Methanobacterium sp.]HOI70968.1 Coenzyme F420 hydrogenase/dehydrogenase, beta subunit C-terminal domain [Methanobacterium sp.]
MKSDHIIQIINEDLCVGCGTCVSICPNEALDIIIDKNKGIYIPKFNEKICNNCKTCLKVCPMYRFNLDSRNIPKDKKAENYLLGHFFNCYIGYATDVDIRYNSSSGGLITQLLIFALENKIIDGAIVTKMKKDNPLEPETFIARTKKDIIESSKSKYCPVPLNIVLREIINSKEDEKFAIVGLPCHINGIINAEKINKKLKDKIIIKFGIFCNHTPNFLATELYLEKKGIKKEKINKLEYRGDGWPGYMNIHLKDKSKINVPLPEYWHFIGSKIFYSKFCFMCQDATSESADISFGDAWLPEFMDDHIGTSIMISRTETGEKLLKMNKLENKIKLNKVNNNEVIKSQLEMLYVHKILNFRTKELLKHYNLFESNYLDFIIASLSFFNNYIFQFSFSMKVLKYMPFQIIWFYNTFFNTIYSIRARRN